MRHLWNTKNGRIFGLITAPKRLKSNRVKSLIEDALWSQDIRKKSQLNGNRYEFQLTMALENGSKLDVKYQE